MTEWDEKVYRFAVFVDWCGRTFLFCPQMTQMFADFFDRITGYFSPKRTLNGFNVNSHGCNPWIVNEKKYPNPERC